ncbi:hypothetical protein K449DRAFT_380504, partial [Hypoxylon sp. EC38]
MQRLTRQFVTTASRLSSWCELLNTVAGAEALLLRTTNPLLFQLAAWQSPTTPPGVYCRYQIRGFRIPASLRSKEETVAKGRKKKKSDPLRILFCGSDEFSDASLLALFKEHESNQELIHSIDVVVRPGKPTGRGNKVIQYPTTRETAETLGVPIHERDTFTGWNVSSFIHNPSTTPYPFYSNEYQNIMPVISSPLGNPNTYLNMAILTPSTPDAIWYKPHNSSIVRSLRTAASAPTSQIRRSQPPPILPPRSPRPRSATTRHPRRPPLHR